METPKAVDPFAAPRDPLKSHADPTVVRRDIPIFGFVGSWDPATIAVALASHKVGQFSLSSDLTDDLFADDRVQATLGSRTGALFGQDCTHSAAKGDDGSCLEEWTARWPDFAEQGILSEIKRWAIMIGFGVAEILWDTSVTPWRLSLKPWHPKFIYYRHDIRRLVASTQDGQIVIEPGDGRWFVHAPFGIYRGWIHASIRAIADKWYFKQMAWRDRARYNERHGLPIIKAMVPATGDARQKEQFVRSMSTMGQEAVVGLPQNVDETGYDISLLEARDRAWETFRSTIEDADRAIVLTIKSQNLTTEVSGGGSFAAARQHGGTEQVTLEFDNNTFAQDLYKQVARPFALFNYGDAELAPRTSWNIKPIEDRVARAKGTLDAASALVALRQSGVPVDVTAYAIAFDIPIDLTAEPPSKIGTMYKYHLDAGIPTVNEAREALGLVPREGGDVPTEPTGFRE